MNLTWIYLPDRHEGQDTDVFFSNIEDETAVTTSDFRVNPFIDLENQHQIYKYNVLNANLNASVKILEGLTFRTVAGVREDKRNFEQFYNSNTSQGSDKNPYNTNGVNGYVRN